MSGYVSVAVVLVVSVTAWGVLTLVARRMRVAAPEREVLPFGSGWDLQEHALSRYHTRWYPMTLVFLAFDVEMLFMYPWATVAGSIGAKAITEMFVFLGILMVAVLWAWREGVFRWQ